MVPLDDGHNVPAAAVQAAVVHTVVACPQPPLLTNLPGLGIVGVIGVAAAITHERWKVTAQSADRDGDLMVPLAGSRLAELDDTVEFGEPTEMVVQTLAGHRL